MAAITHTHFVPALDGAAGEYTVEERTGSTRVTIGRVAKIGPKWMALGVLANAWTDYYATRAQAVEMMRRGITFRTRS
jgi:hypothetical protein